MNARSLVGLVIDTLEFAREGRSVAGFVPVLALPRVADLVADGELACTLNGRRESGRNWLDLTVRGHLELVCQRCLESMPHELDVTAEIQVIAAGESWPDEELEDGTLRLGADAIAAELEQSVTDLVEEEVLLALPISPRHEHDCAQPARGDEKLAASPFAMLATLKKH
ncbi:MAG TPA: YceD family protein [Rhodocyclaceae bacterium]|jgi:uncharacterized protein|nr:YceD family protein [Rhodocyclaceae bacterium]